MLLDHCARLADGAASAVLGGDASRRRAPPRPVRRLGRGVGISNERPNTERPAAARGYLGHIPAVLQPTPIKGCVTSWPGPQSRRSTLYKPNPPRRVAAREPPMGLEATKALRSRAPCP